jgi:hypothetical protein
MARLEEATAKEEAPQGRGRPSLRRGALGARGRGAGALPPPPEGPEAKLNMEEPSKNRSKASLSWTSPYHPHLTWWM